MLKLKGKILRLRGGTEKWYDMLSEKQSGTL